MNSRSLKIGLLLLSMAASGLLRGLEFDIYSLQDGLASARINDVQEGPRGYLYLATDQGLSRFDGHNFVNFPRDYPLATFAEPGFHKLRLHRDTLYALSRSGGYAWLALSSYQSGRVRVAGGLSDLLFRHGQRYLYTARGELQRWRGNEQRACRQFRGGYGQLLFGRAGRLYLSDDRGLYAVAARTLALENQVAHRGLAFYPHEVLYRNKSGFAFRSMQSSRFYSYQLEPAYALSDSIPPLSNTALRPAGAERWWGIENFNRLYGPGPEATALRTALAEYELRQLYQVDKQRIYLATNRGLVVIRLDPAPFYAFRDAGHGEGQEAVRVRRSILSDSLGRIFLLGYPSLQVVHPDGRQRSFHVDGLYTYDGLLTDSVLYCAAEGYGLSIFDRRKRRWRFVRTPQGAGAYLYVIEKASDGSFFLGGYDGLYRYRPGAEWLQRCRLRGAPPDLRIYDLAYLAPSGRLLAATSAGLARLHPDSNGTWRWQAAPAAPPRGGARCLHYDADRQLIFLGTQQGIALHDYPSLRRRPGAYTAPRTGDPRVLSFLPGPRGALWFSTMSGLGRLNKRLVQDRYLDRSDGLQNAEFNYQAATTLGDSLLLFGGLTGYDGIYPARWPRDTSPPPQVAAVARYTFADRKKRFLLDSLGELQFFRGRERISLYLRLPHQRARRGRFEYRVNEGPWNTARGGIIAGLPGIEEGLHQLDLRFLPLGQLDADRFRRIKFRVRLPWHQSQRFRLLLLILLLVLLLLFLWQAYRLARRERRVRREVAMDLHDEVGTLLTRARFLLRGRERQESLLANTLAEAGQSLKLYVSTLQSGPRDFPQLVVYLEDFLFGFFQGSSLEFELSAPQRPSLPLPEKVFRDIIMVVREAASNTQKHARAAAFYLALRVEKGYIYLDIWDDGSFKEPAPEGVGTGYGLANMRRRAERAQGYGHQHLSAEGALHLSFRFKVSET